MFTDGEAIYALSLNYRLGYLGLQIFTDDEETDNYFFQNVDSELEENFLNLGRLEIMERLADYLC